jgi:hypothetical protein
MGEINLSEHEKTAIRAVDERALERLIERAVGAGRLGEIYQLPLAACGPYVANKLHRFGQSLDEHNRAKSAKKRAETRTQAERDGRDLSFAVNQMKGRLEKEEKNAERFHVYDDVYWPSRFSMQMTVSIRYRYRQAVEDEWSHGSITFSHDADIRPDHASHPPRRKPSAAEQARQLQEKLSNTWEYLMKGALYALRDYFEEGGDGAKIPETFRATVDGRGGLNNFSTRFWIENPAG